MEKRIYSESEFELAFIELLSKIKNVNTRKDEKELLSGIFQMNGEPYEPATPTAPSMSDEDKVWMAAVQLYKTEEELFIADRMFMAVKHSFELLDELRDQQAVRQEEREGKV